MKAKTTKVTKTTKKPTLAKVMAQKSAAKKAMDAKVQGAGLLKLVGKDSRFKRAGS